MQQLTPEQLTDWLNTGKDFVLADVREAWEHEAYNIGGTLIPMGDIMAHIGELPRDKDIVLYCEKGIRSVIAIQRLEGMGYTRLYNLAGGMKNWKESQQH